MSDIKKFLRDNPLLVKIPPDRVLQFRFVLCKADESYPFQFSEEIDETDGGTIFSIVCTTKYSPEAYYHLGKLSAQMFMDVIKNPFKPG